MKNLNDRYAEIIKTRYEENTISGKAAVEYMQNSTAVYKGVPVACLYMPKVFSTQAVEFLRGASATICTILDKVIQRYFDDADYRSLFPFSKELEELILLESGYPRLLPIARLDIFFNEEDFTFKFCEFNADGSSAMNEDREINLAVQSTDAFLHMQKEYRLTSFELFDSWVKEFMDIYSHYNKKVLSPKIMITDFMEKGTPNEFIEFKKAFKKAGLDADICDIREFGKTAKADAVYRRAVTRDIIENKNEASGFLQAARDNTMCIIGHFRTQIIHNKAIFMILRKHETLEFLTKEEQEYIIRHIPETLPLKSVNQPVSTVSLDDVIKNKDEWIIKPEDFYASKGVYAGIGMDTDAWQSILQESINSSVPYLLQEYHKPYRSVNINFNKNNRPDFEMYNNITGMFVYNGKLTGLYSRAGQQNTISSDAGGLTLASVMASDYNRI